MPNLAFPEYLALQVAASHGVADTRPAAGLSGGPSSLDTPVVARAPVSLPGAATVDEAVFSQELARLHARVRRAGDVMQARVSVRYDARAALVPGASEEALLLADADSFDTSVGGWLVTPEGGVTGQGELPGVDDQCRLALRLAALEAAPVVLGISAGQPVALRETARELKLMRSRGGTLSLWVELSATVGDEDPASPGCIDPQGLSAPVQVELSMTSLPTFAGLMRAELG